MVYIVLDPEYLHYLISKKTKFKENKIFINNINKQ